MNENKHTPEPWATKQSRLYGNETMLVDKDDHYIASIRANSDLSDGDSQDIARRITACVNACAGIPTYQLTAENDIPTNLGEVIDAIRDQRDILLAALDRLAFAAECRDNTTGDQCRLIEVRAELAAAAANARAAIAAATGTNITATIKCAANCGADVPVMAKDEGEDHLCHHCGRDAG